MIIDPSRLRTLRQKRGLSQEELAEKTKTSGQPKIDKQTISRLERGAAGKARGRTVQQLARALGVEPAVLAGDAPVPDSSREDGPSTPKSQFNVRVSRSARNALTLVSQSYKVHPSQIVELAPFLFFWAAEASLRHRRDAIDQFARARADLTNRGHDIPHVFAAYDLWDEPIEEKLIASERASIEMGDIFGLFVCEETAAWDDDVEDPFSAFLSNLVKDFTDEAEFNGFDLTDGTPDYRVCVEFARRLAGGDQELADMILRGYVALHEMPRDLRPDSASLNDRLTKEEVNEERIQWMLANIEHYTKELQDNGKVETVSEQPKGSTSENA